MTGPCFSVVPYIAQHYSKFPQHKSTMANFCVAGKLFSPKRAADMLPIVTDMFIQCKNVRSLAAQHMSLSSKQ